MRTLSSVPIGHLRDHVISQGVHTLTLDDVITLTGLSRSAAAEAMRRARSARQFFAPAPGFYVAIPSEYAGWGVVPAMDFIDQLMRFLRRSYYVGLLSAAQLHGAAHQQPQVFQVMVDRPVADRDIERVRLRFYERARVDDVPVVMRNSATSQVRVSTAEATAFDLVARPGDSGALFNVATVVGELATEDKLQADDLVALAPRYPIAVIRRLGWLLDRVAEYVDTTALADQLHEYLIAHESAGRRAVDLLAVGGPRRGATNRRWGLVENATVEPDL